MRGCDTACNSACSTHMQALAVPPAILAFALSPRMCHAFMTTLSGLTGEALTDALRDLDANRIPAWDAMSLPAPVPGALGPAGGRQHAHRAACPAR